MKKDENFIKINQTVSLKQSFLMRMQVRKLLVEKSSIKTEGNMTCTGLRGKETKNRKNKKDKPRKREKQDNKERRQQKEESLLVVVDLCEEN